MKTQLLFLSLVAFACSKAETKQSSLPKNECKKTAGAALFQMNLVDLEKLVRGEELGASESSLIIKVLPAALKDVSDISCSKKDSQIACQDSFGESIKMDEKDAKAVYEMTVELGFAYSDIEIDPLEPVEFEPKIGNVEPKKAELKLDETLKESEIAGYYLQGIFCEGSKCTYGSFEQNNELDGADSVDSLDDAASPQKGDAPTSPAPVTKKTSSSDSSKCN